MMARKNGARATDAIFGGWVGAEGDAVERAANRPMRVLVADDHPMYRDALELYLMRDWPEASLTAVGSLEELDALAQRPEGRDFDLVVMDWQLPGGEGGAGLDRLDAAGINSPVAVVTGHDDAAIAREALTRGACAFLPKTLSSVALVQMLKVVAVGGSVVPADVALRMAGALPAPLGPHGAAPDGGGLLTEREREVLEHLAGGATNKEIGRMLDLQEVTIKLHTRRILRKLGAKNRVEAVTRARDQGLLGGP
ncbi:response regulator transcription factor [Nitrospirillum sp. BR 11163]|uniref:response regulator transcription factor n=1 Tax=Nitrospirillum sp. BR 11163 TaxID=3104323 RepID=UPI002AFF8CF3|nr:response regulator transcription factor [Nitrospirillum sp. BR 11163]MEA1672233.1 response regulator transcription factor [Nitrospirillum sp. BR 11163]